MEVEEPPVEEGTIETEEGVAGDPQEMDRSAVVARAEETSMLPAEELEERQRSLRTERLTGGPDLEADTAAREEVPEEVPDVEPTEVEEAEDAPPPPAPA